MDDDQDEPNADNGPTTTTTSTLGTPSTPTAKKTNLEDATRETTSSMHTGSAKVQITRARSLAAASPTTASIAMDGDVDDGSAGASSVARSDYSPVATPCYSNGSVASGARRAATSSPSSTASQQASSPVGIAVIAGGTGRATRVSARAAAAAASVGVNPVEGGVTSGLENGGVGVSDRGLEGGSDKSLASRGKRKKRLPDCATRAAAGDGGDTTADSDPIPSTKRRRTSEGLVRGGCSAYTSPPTREQLHDNTEEDQAGEGGVVVGEEKQPSGADNGSGGNKSTTVVTDADDTTALTGDKSETSPEQNKVEDVSKNEMIEVVDDAEAADVMKVGKASSGRKGKRMNDHAPNIDDPNRPWLWKPPGYLAADPGRFGAFDAPAPSAGRPSLSRSRSPSPASVRSTSPSGTRVGGDISRVPSPPPTSALRGGSGASCTLLSRRHRPGRGTARDPSPPPPPSPSDTVGTREIGGVPSSLKCKPSSSGITMSDERGKGFADDGRLRLSSQRKGLEDDQEQDADKKDEQEEDEEGDCPEHEGAVTRHQPEIRKGEGKGKSRGPATIQSKSPSARIPTRADALGGEPGSNGPASTSAVVGTTAVATITQKGDRSQSCGRGASNDVKGMETGDTGEEAASAGTNGWKTGKVGDTGKERGRNSDVEEERNGEKGEEQGREEEDQDEEGEGDWLAGLKEDAQWPIRREPLMSAEFLADTGVLPKVVMAEFIVLVA